MSDAPSSADISTSDLVLNWRQNLPSQPPAKDCPKSPAPESETAAKWQRSKQYKQFPVMLDDGGFSLLSIEDKPKAALKARPKAGTNDVHEKDPLHPPGEKIYGPPRPASVRGGSPPRQLGHSRSKSYPVKSAYQNPFDKMTPADRGRGRGHKRNATTAVSPEAQAAQQLMMHRNSVRRMFKHSEVAKWKIGDFKAHKEAMATATVEDAARRAADAADEANAPSWSPPTFTVEDQEKLRYCGLWGNFDEVGNTSRILGERTIWCRDWRNGKEEVAPWPCAGELKWEGDDRAKTGVGRFPPLPREPGPLGLPWHALEVVEQYPLDKIAQVPTMEDIFLPVDEIDDAVKGDLLLSCIEEAIAESLEH